MIVSMLVLVHPDRPGEVLLGDLRYVEWLGPRPAKIGAVNAAVLVADGEPVAAASSSSAFR